MGKIQKLTIVESLWSLANLIRDNWPIIASGVSAAGGVVIAAWKYIQLAADLEGWWVYPAAISIIFFACLAFFATCRWLWRKFTNAPTQTNPQPESLVKNDDSDHTGITNVAPQPHYSAADKDRISEMLHEIHEVLEKQVKPTELNAQRIRQMWDRSDRLEYLPLMIEQLSKIEEEIRNQQQLLKTDIRKRYQRYEKIYSEVMGSQIPDAMSEFAQETRNYTQHLRFTSELLNTLEDSQMAGKLVYLNNASLNCFRDKTGKLSGYMTDCINRIRDAEHRLLYR